MKMKQRILNFIFILVLVSILLCAMFCAAIMFSRTIARKSYVINYYTFTSDSLDETNAKGEIKADTVFVKDNETVYHKEGCHDIDLNGDDTIYAMPEQLAIYLGYTPCEKCFGENK